MPTATAMIGQDLYYHGKSLLEDFSCVAEKWPDMEMGGPSYTEHVVIGVDGKMYQSDRRDTDTILTFTCLFHVRPGYSYRDTYREIREWIYSSGEEKLKESRNSGYFWKVKKATVSPVKPTSNHAASFQLTFIVDDHEYIDDVEDIELEISSPDDELIILLETSSGGTFYLIDDESDDQGRPAEFPMLSHPAWIILNEHAESHPIYHLTGDYGFAFYVNDTLVDVNLYGVEGMLAVDTDKMVAKDSASHKSCNTAVTGDYSGMRLKHGSNLIYLASDTFNDEQGYISINLSPNWRIY